MMAAQVIACIIFVAMFIMIVMEKIERHLVTLLCGALTLIVVFGLCMHSAAPVWATMNLHSIITPSFWYEAGGASSSTGGINWETIIFVACMMIMVEGMAHAGFFRWLCMKLARMVHYQVIPLFIVFMIMSAVLAMFIDSITVILFLAAITVELSQLLKFNPVPMILAEIFCANLGGTATMCGNPPNIIIGTSLGFSFADFISNAGLMCFVTLAVILVYFFFAFRKQLVCAEPPSRDPSNYPDPAASIRSKASFVTSCVIFAAAVVLLVTHNNTGISVALIGVIVAAATVLTNIKHCGTILKKVDYKTVLFFVGLFIVVGGLEQTGVLEVIAGMIGTASGGSAIAVIVIILWVSAIASAFVDNIPFAAIMIPVIRSLSATQGVALPTLAWTLAMGANIGGSATPIGASANVVGTSVAAKAGHPISWGTYCKKLVPATLIVIVLSMLIIFVRYL